MLKIPELQTEANQLKSLERRLVDASVEPIMFSYNVLHNITNKFTEEIGRGGFATVYVGAVTNGKVAVKKLNKFDNNSDKNYDNELICLIRVNHDNIVRLVGYCSATLRQMVEHEEALFCVDRQHRFLCFEYAPNKSLYDYLKDKTQGRDWSTCYRLIKGICLGLEYLHKNKMNHLDMKPDNILLDADLVPKITDFGLARIFGKNQSSMVIKDIIGTKGYAAPEFVEGGLISYKTDIYSLGIIIINILTGTNAVPDKEEKWHGSVDFEGPQVKGCIEIAQACIDPDQCKRPAIGDIIDSLNAMECLPEVSSLKSNKLASGHKVIINEEEPTLEASNTAGKSALTKTSNTPTAFTIEIHPTEPWIMTTSMNHDYSCYIWNYETQEVKSIEIAESRSDGQRENLFDGKIVSSAKFIARKKWIVCGTSAGLLHVHSYDPVQPIRTLSGHSTLILDLDVHTTEPYVLSACLAGKIVIWNYEKEWEIITSFCTSEACSPCAKFHPQDKNIIAYCDNHDIKFWNMDSEKCELTMSGQWGYYCLSFFSNSGGLYLISGSKDDTAMIWDCKTGSCIKILEGHQDEIRTAFCHPDLPLLITGSFDGSIYVWHSHTFGLRRKINLGLEEVICGTFFKGSTRITIGHSKAIAIVELGGDDLEEICSPDASDVMITVNPLEFCFPRLQREVNFSVNIVNNTNSYVAYNLVPPGSTNKYTISLPRGVVSPLSTLECVITRVAKEFEQKHVQVRNIAILQSTIVRKGLTERYLTDDLFEREMGRSVLDVELGFTSVATSIAKSPVIKSNIGEALSIDIHPEKPWIMTTSNDANVSIWDYQTQEVKTIETAAVKYDYQKRIKSAMFIAHKKWILALSRVGLIHVYSYDPEEKIRTLNEHSTSLHLNVHATEPYVVSSSKDGKIVLWNYEKEWEILASFRVEHNDYLPLATFHPKKKNIIAYCDGFKIKFRNMDSNDCELTLSGHSSTILCLSFYSDGDKVYLISGAIGGTAKIWECKTGTRFVRLKGQDGTRTALCHPYLPLLITGSADGSVCVWDSRTFRLQRTMNFSLGYVTGIAYLKGSTRIAIGHLNGIAVVDLEEEDKDEISVDPLEFCFPSLRREVQFSVNIVNITDKCVAYNLVPQDRTANYTISLTRGIVSPRSTLECVITRVANEKVPRNVQAKNVAILQSTIVSNGFTERDLTDDLFKIEMFRTVHEVELGFIPVATSGAKSPLIKSDIPSVWTLQMHRLDPWIMTTSGDTNVYLWNYQTKEVKIIKIAESGADKNSYDKPITSAKFIPHRNWIVASSSDGRLHVHSYDPVAQIHVLCEHSTYICDMDIHATESYLLSASTDGKIVVWSYEKEWEVIEVVYASGISPRGTFHPNDKNMIAYSDGYKIKFWNFRSHDSGLTLSSHSSLIECLGFFSNGEVLYLISGSEDNTARIWDCKTGSCIQILRGHESGVSAAFCHPNLPVLVTGSKDGSVYLWNFSTFRLESILKIGLGEVNDISCDMVSTRIAIGHLNGIAVVDIGPAEHGA